MIAHSLSEIITAVYYTNILEYLYEMFHDNIHSNTLSELVCLPEQLLKWAMC